MHAWHKVIVIDTPFLVCSLSMTCRLARAIFSSTQYLPSQMCIRLRSVLPMSLGNFVDVKVRAVSTALDFPCTVSDVEMLNLWRERTCCSSVCVCCSLRWSASFQASLLYLFPYDQPTSDRLLWCCQTCLDIEILALCFGTHHS